LSGPVLAFDVGGTHLRSVLVAPDGTLHGRRSRATPRGSCATLVEALAEEGRAQVAAARRLLASPPRAVGLAIAGFTDTARGLIHQAPNLGLHEALVGPPLREALGLPVRLVNDVNAAAVAEARAFGVRDLVAVFLGTGVGGGIVGGGRLLEGRHGMAAEIGHAPFRPGAGPRCGAGHDGCFEAFLGGACLERRMQAAGLADGVGALWPAARAGDARAGRLAGEAEDALRALCVLLVTLLDPEVISLAGGMGSAVPELLAAARGACDPHPLDADVGAVRVLPAATGDDAGLLGAAWLAGEA
jgi:predicted NBD/HSP70 family sugar kinase